MSYEKLGFIDGQVLEAEHLNHIEDGIVSMGNSGVTHWDDLEGKPFYKRNILLESQTDIEFTSNDYGLFTPLANKGYRFDDTFKKVTVNFNGYGEQESTNIRSTYNINLGDTIAYIVGNSSLFSDYYLPSSGFSDIPHVDTGEPYAVVFICDKNDNVINGLLFITNSFMENPTGFSITATIKKTLHEEFIDSTIPRTPTAKVGQVVRVKAVDERGVPTEWEAADMGGSDSIFITYNIGKYSVTCDIPQDVVAEKIKNGTANVYLELIQSSTANDVNILPLSSFRYYKNNDSCIYIFYKNTTEYQVESNSEIGFFLPA